MQQYKKVSIPVQRNPDFSNLQEKRKVIIATGPSGEQFREYSVIVQVNSKSDECEAQGRLEISSMITS